MDNVRLLPLPGRLVARRSIPDILEDVLTAEMGPMLGSKRQLSSMWHKHQDAWVLYVWCVGKFRCTGPRARKPRLIKPGEWADVYRTLAMGSGDKLFSEHYSISQPDVDTSWPVA